VLRHNGRVSVVLWSVIPLAVVAGLYYLAYRIEPHWVSKDGRRFLCNVEPITKLGVSEGRPRETRVMVLPDGSLQLDRRRPMRKRLSEVWTLAGRSPDAPPKRAVYVLNMLFDDGSAGQLAVRLPADSRAVPVLDEILARRR
jgi:hypothetical protein